MSGSPTGRAGGVAWYAMLVSGRILPWVVLVGLWAAVGPEVPYGTSDYVLIAAIVTACLGSLFAFDRLLRRLRGSGTGSGASPSAAPPPPE